MKKLYFLIIAIGITFSVYSQQWTKINTGYDYIFKAIDFPEGQNNIGFAGGQSVTYQGDGIVIKTTDGGNTWSQLWMGVQQGIEGMSFPTLQTGYVCGWSGYFAKTTDGGINWTVSTPGSDIYYYNDVCFKDANNGVLVASLNDGVGVWVTSNGGSTWTAGTGINAVPYKLCYAGGNTYYAATNSGDVLKSTDNGLTWSISYDSGGLFVGVDFYNVNVGIVAGEDGRIVKTYDGGATWQEQVIAYGNPIWHDFAWSDANTVLAVGTPETIWKSTDGGSSWSDDYPQSTYNPAIYEVLYVNGIAYACGSQGWFYRKAPELNAGFTVNESQICNGSSVQFTDQSSGSPTGWNWTFEGGIPSTSTLQNPTVNYPTAGVYDVTLTVTKGSLSNTLYSPDLITVQSPLTNSPTQPTGSQIVCGTTVNTYFTTAISNVETYYWAVSPSSAGVITGTGLSGTYTAANNWSGDYQITVRGTNSCGQGPVSPALTGTLNHKPIAYSIFAGGGYCEGSQGAEIILEDSELGVSYQLYNNGTPQGDVLAGTGEELSFGYQTSGEYTITGENGFCSTDMLGAASVYLIYIPQAANTPTGPTDICNNTSSQYTAVWPENAMSIEWVLNPAEAGNITTINYNTIEISWNPEFSGLAYLSVQGVNQCGAGQLSNPLTINVSASPRPVIEGDNLSCINYAEIYSVAAVAGFQYDWTVVNGTISSGQGTNSINVDWTTSGTAQIMVNATNPAGCSGSSDEFTVTVDLCTTNNTLIDDEIRIFPNPTSESLNIQLGQSVNGVMSIAVYDNKGRQVIIKELNVNLPQSLLKLNTSTLSSGIYYLRIVRNTGTGLSLKFMKD